MQITENFQIFGTTQAHFEYSNFVMKYKCNFELRVKYVYANYISEITFFFSSNLHIKFRCAIDAPTRDHDPGGRGVN